jgi:hypothetical protein
MPLSSGFIIGGSQEVPALFSSYTGNFIDMGTWSSTRDGIPVIYRGYKLTSSGDITFLRRGIIDLMVCGAAGGNGGGGGTDGGSGGAGGVTVTLNQYVKTDTFFVRVGLWQSGIQRNGQECNSHFLGTTGVTGGMGAPYSDRSAGSGANWGSFGFDSRPDYAAPTDPGGGMRGQGAVEGVLGIGRGSRGGSYTSTSGGGGSSTGADGITVPAEWGGTKITSSGVICVGRNGPNRTTDNTGSWGSNGFIVVRIMQ